MLESKMTGVKEARHSPFSLPFQSLHYFIISLAGPIIGIISTERIIASNGLATTNVSESTGQMIALLAGVTGMCTTIWEVAGWWNTRNKSMAIAKNPRYDDRPHTDLEDILVSRKPLGFSEPLQFRLEPRRREKTLSNEPEVCKLRRLSSLSSLKTGTRY